MEPLIHLGYVKTGSTWLQKHLFNNSAAQFGQVGHLDGTRDLLIKPNSLWYDRAAIHDYLAPDISRYQAQGLIPVVSNERFAGNPISGGYDGIEIANRLLDLLPQGRVVLVIREQKKMMLSLYKQYVKEGGSCTLEQFWQDFEGAKVPRFDVRFLEFHRLIQCYQDRFEHVLVLPFELFLADKVEFCNQLIAFAGGDPIESVPDEVVNQAFGGFELMMRCRTNFLFHRDMANPSALFDVPKVARGVHKLSGLLPRSFHKRYDQKMKQLVEEKLSGRYCASNQATIALTGLDLANYGYEV